MCLILQTDKEIHQVSIGKQSSVPLSFESSMMRQYMTQDRLGKIFFAEKNRDKLEVLSLTLDEEKLQKTRVFIGTYELAALNADNALGFKEEDQSGIFILSYDGKMHHLKK